MYQYVVCDKRWMSVHFYIINKAIVFYLFNFGYLNTFTRGIVISVTFFITNLTQQLVITKLYIIPPPFPYNPPPFKHPSLTRGVFVRPRYYIQGFQKDK